MPRKPLLFALIAAIVLADLVLAAPALADTSLGTAAAGAQTTMSQVTGWFTGSGDPLTIFFMNHIFGSLFPGSVTSSVVTAVIVVLNMTLLAVAALFAIAQIILGATQTAHSGKLLGEQQSFWGPVRLAVAAILLIPIPSQSYYNTGQLIVAWLVKGSSMAASQMWKTGVEAISTGTLAAQNATGVPVGVAHAVWNMSVCEAATNALYNQANNGNNSTSSGAFVTTPQSGAVMTASAWQSAFPGTFGWFGLAQASAGASSVTTTTTDGQILMSRPNTATAAKNADSLLGACGQIAAPATPAVLQSGAGANQAGFQNAWNSALVSLKTSMDAAASNLVSSIIQVQPTDMSALSQTAAFQSILTATNNSLQSSLSGISKSWLAANPITSSSSSISCPAPSSSSTASTTVSACMSSSWLSAGSYYIALSRTLAGANAITTSVPAVSLQPSWIAELQDQSSASYGSGAMTTLAFYQRVAAKADALWEQGGLGGPVLPAAGLTSPAGTADKTATSGKAVQGGSTLDGIIARIPGFGDVGAYKTALGDISQDPMLSVVGLGQAFTTIAIGFFTVLAIIAVTPISGVAIFLAPMAATMLGIGVFFGYILPLLVFLVWIIAVVGYFVIIIEAIVAVSLWAIAHMRFAGEGLAGAAQAGYMILLSITLTPVLMVVGLLASMMTAWIGGVLINLSWSTVWSAAPTGPFGQMIFWITLSIVFGYLYWMLIERAFFLISAFPSQIFRWIGHSEAPLTKGEEREIRVATAGLGYVGGRTAGGAIVQPAAAVGTFTRKLIADKVKSKGKATGTP